jgi:hypothetical protein
MQTAPFLQPISDLSQQSRDFQELGLLSRENLFISCKNVTLPILEISLESLLGLFLKLDDNNDKTSNLRIPHHRGSFVQPLLQWESNRYQILWVCL